MSAMESNSARRNLPDPGHASRELLLLRPMLAVLLPLLPQQLHASLLAWKVLHAPATAAMRVKSAMHISF